MEQIDIIGSDIPNHHLRKDEPNCNKSVGAYCAGVSTVAMACGEPGMRRNGLRILVEINNKLYEEVSFGNNAADTINGKRRIRGD